MEEQELKAKIVEILKAKGYHESQLKELTPIIENTINATKEVLNLEFVGKQSELFNGFWDYLDSIPQDEYEEKDEREHTKDYLKTIV